MKKLLMLSLIATSSFAMGADKYKHMAVGGLIYNTCYMKFGSKAGCFLTTTAIAIGKEIYDKNKEGHKSELGDVIATISIPLVLINF